VCSGISAPTMAWKPLGWEALCFAEIEAAPRAVLAHHYPDTPLRGDFTEIEGSEYGPVDLLVGGTPCQSFSVAGLRKGMDDERGNLALEYLRLADRARPKWLAWENVPGVLSANGGRDFGSILGGLGELGYGFAYRVLDARYFGVPQGRQRVFLIGCSGNWRSAAAVLFERHSLEGHPAPVCGRVFNAFDTGIRSLDRASKDNVLWTSEGPRFATPLEVERAFGFPDDFTLVPYRKGMMADGPRYKMLGNSMAVPVVRWIGERIQLVEEIAAQRVAA
jgi:site-specific DNA-cytosine methylase